MIAIDAAARPSRASQPPRAATKAADPPDPDTAAQEQQLAAQRATFDFHVEENAELVREHQALQDLMMMQLKAEDEILKKYIELA